MRAGHVFLIALLLSLISHGIYWRYLDDSPDQQNWIDEMTAFHETDFREHRSSLYYGYPATTLLGASSILYFFGIPASQAFNGIMVLGISLPIAFSTLLCYLLRPKTLWWVGVMGLMITSQLYYGATPPSAIVTALISLMMLYALYISEKKKDDVLSSMLVGSIAGFALATRLDISLIIVFFLLVFLFPIIQRNVLTLLVSAGVVFVVCDPYMQVFPLQHLTDIVHKITYHTNLGSASVFPLRALLLTIPLSVLGLLASILVFLFPHVLSSPPSRRFLGFILFACVSISAALSIFSSYHPAWYFYPVLQIFELLFVLYLLDALTLIGRSFAVVPVLLILIVGNGIVFFRKLFL